MQVVSFKEEQRCADKTVWSEVWPKCAMETEAWPNFFALNKLPCLSMSLSRCVLVVVARSPRSEVVLQIDAYRLLYYRVYIRIEIEPVA